MAYRVQLDAFHGPLDLLLYLVKKEEVDVLDISIARLADQFLAYLQTVRQLDVEFAGEFLVMAATLMEIKSRALIPQAEVPVDERGAVDPRRELVRQLLEYRRFKDATARLDDAAERHAARYRRIAPEPAAQVGAPAVRAVELWDLVSAFARLLRETQSAQPQSVVIDDTPQAVHESRILNLLSTARDVAFDDLFERPFVKMRIIGLFLALLELIKSGKITITQCVPFGPMKIRIVEPITSH